ncbi:MAG TPA: hypothetical protein VJ890_15020, partial [Vineibacter sp.]|nr:hypothetical protein [Vineibacter sp.]
MLAAVMWQSIVPPPGAWAQSGAKASTDAPPPVAAAPAGTEADKAPIRLRMQTAFNPGVSVLGEAGRELVSTLKRVSGGKLTIKILEAGAKAPTAELLDAVQRGDVDAAFTTPAYAAVREPALMLFASLPFGPTPEEYVT